LGTLQLNWHPLDVSQWSEELPHQPYLLQQRPHSPLALQPALPKSFPQRPSARGGLVVWSVGVGVAEVRVEVVVGRVEVVDRVVVVGRVEVVDRVVVVEVVDRVVVEVVEVELLEVVVVLVVVLVVLALQDAGSSRHL